MLHRLHTRLAAGYILLVAAVFVLLGLYLAFYVQGLQRDELQTRLRSQAWLVADAAGPLIASGQTAELEALAQRTGEEAGARVTLIDTSGAVLGDSEVDNDTLQNHASRPEVAAALRGEIGEASRFSATLDRTLIYLAVPIQVDGQLVGVARLATPSDQFSSGVNHIILVMSAALAIAAVAIAILSIVLSRLITRPLDALVDAAERFAAGDTGARAPERAPGELADLAIAFNNMTEQLRTTIGTIEGERERLETLVENLDDGVLMIDALGWTVMINGAGARLLGIRRDRAIGRPYREVVRDHELADLIRQSREPGASGSRVVERRYPRRTIQAFAYAIPHPETPIVLILRDITELRRTDAVRRDFVANVSHELRTPIASLKALVETLLDGALEDQDAARDFLERMLAEVDGLAMLVRDLLELSRVESGQISIEAVPSEVDHVIERVMARMQTQAEPQAVTLRADIAEDLPAGLFDPSRVEQILVNLVDNAIKYSPEGGTVTIGATRDDEALRIWVDDTGPGIPAEYLERVFERFFKASRSRADSGTGLGLAITRHLVQLQGGHIWAENLPRGARFSFTVPLATMPEPTAHDAIGSIGP